MISLKKSGGYSHDVYNRIIGNVPVIVLIGDGPRPVNEFVNNKPTDTILNYRMDFYFKGIGTQSVKLPANFKLDSGIKDMSEFTLVNVMGIQIRSKVYFKADDVQPRKV